MEAINRVMGRYSCWSSKRTGALVAQAVWAHNGFIPELVKLSCQYFRANVFTPYNVLREMDLAGGTLSYEGIDEMRRVETGGLKHFKEGSMIPSKSQIERMAGIVEWFARPLCPYTFKVTSMGEAVEFDYGLTMRCILRAFHLEEIGKRRSLSVASSIDGASLCKWHQDNGLSCNVSSDKENFARQPNSNERTVSKSLYSVEENDGTGDERHVHQVRHTFSIP